MMNDLRKVAQVSTDTKSAIGGTRMSEAATPAVAAGNRVSTTRIVGGVGVALAASVVVQNAWFFLGGGAPTYGDPLGEVLAYHAEKDRKSTRLNSSHANISYAVFCLIKKNTCHPSSTF